MNIIEEDPPFIREKERAIPTSNRCGIAYFLKNNKVIIQKTHPQFMHVCISEGHRTPWYLTIIYGSPNQHLRKLLWRDLNLEVARPGSSWLAAGDFNSVTSGDETSTPGKFNQNRSVGLNSWMFQHGLINLGYTGPTFTWTRGNSSQTFKGERLDRAVCTVEWSTLFPDANVSVLLRINSDHSPLLINIEGGGNYSDNRLFRFQAACFSHPGFMDFLKLNCKGPTLLWKIIILFQKDSKYGIRSNLVLWKRRRNAFGVGLVGIQMAISQSRNAHLRKLESKLQRTWKLSLTKKNLYGTKSQEENHGPKRRGG